MTATLVSTPLLHTPSAGIPASSSTLPHRAYRRAQRSPLTEVHAARRSRLLAGTALLTGILSLTVAAVAGIAVIV